MKYVAINYYAGDVWVEFTDAENGEDAEFELKRGNVQIILSRDDVVRVLPEIVNKMEIVVNQIMKTGGREYEVRSN